MSWYGFIQKYFGLFFAASMAAGLFLPEKLIFLADWSLPILGCVMGLTFLSIDLEAAFRNLKRLKLIGSIFLVTKGLLPLLIFFAAGPLGPTVQTAALLLSLTPFAAISPTLTRIVGGDAELILVEQVVQTISAPIYLPLFFRLIAGTAIEIDTMQMVKTLVFLIIIPLIVTSAARVPARTLITRTRKYYGALSIILISALLCGLLASASGPVTSDPLKTLPLAGFAVALAVFLMASGWFGFFFLGPKQRIGISLGNVYMNIGLSAVLAADFLGPDVLLFVLLYEFPANLLPPLLRRFKDKKAG